MNVLLVGRTPAVIGAHELSLRPDLRRGGRDQALRGRLGDFDFFLDVGCFQGFDAAQQRAQGDGVTALANPGATLLMLSFGRTRLRSLVGGVSQDEVETAFPAWEPLAVESADTAGLGWPMNKTAPQWFRLRCRRPLADPPQSSG